MSHIKFVWVLVDDIDKLKKIVEKEKNFITLDPDGEEVDSIEFSKKISSFGSKLTFIIGGSEGLPNSINNDAKWVVSLSKLTFTHQITRLILLEQIYRSFEIFKGSEYHKLGKI